MLVVIPHTAHAKTLILDAHLSLRFTKPLAFVGDLRSFPLAGDLHSAFLDEGDDSRQFVGVEPGSVLFAGVDYDAGRPGKIVAVHQLLTSRAGNIADLRKWFGVQFAAADVSEHGRLLFAVGADRLECFGISPEAAASAAFVQRDAADLQDVEADAASRTVAFFAFPYRYLIGPAAAVVTKLGDDEHRLETRRTSDRFQPRQAKWALRGVTRHSGAAVWAI